MVWDGTQLTEANKDLSFEPRVWTRRWISGTVEISKWVSIEACQDGPHLDHAHAWEQNVFFFIWLAFCNSGNFGQTFHGDVTTSDILSTLFQKA